MDPKEPPGKAVKQITGKYQAYRDLSKAAKLPGFTGLCGFFL
jgi:hypothetical protein